MTEIKLGAEVRCRITGFVGIATARLELLDGTVEYAVLPAQTDKGHYPKAQYINAQRLEVVSEGIALPPHKKVLGFHYPPAA